MHFNDNLTFFQDDTDSAYLTASTGLKAEMQAFRPQMSTLTKADLSSRIERFNKNTHELRMNMVYMSFLDLRKEISFIIIQSIDVATLTN